MIELDTKNYLIHIMKFIMELTLEYVIKFLIGLIIF